MPLDPTAKALSRRRNSDLACSGHGRIGIWSHRDTALNCINGRSRECFQRYMLRDWSSKTRKPAGFFRVDAQRGRKPAQP
jgi:hypothetical protein